MDAEIEEEFEGFDKYEMTFVVETERVMSVVRRLSQWKVVWSPN